MAVSKVPVFFIDGIVKRKDRYAPVLREKNAEFDADRLKEVCNNFDDWIRFDNDYFRTRIFCQIAASSYIISASFTPKHLDQSRVLFFQVKQLEHPVGFFAPYLSREDRAEWNARARLPGPRLLSDKASLNQAIQEVGAEYRETLGNLEETASKVNAYYSDLSICIKCFFHDTHFKTMALSYIEPNGKLISRSWIKQSQ